LVPAGMGEVSLQNLSATSSTVLLARPA
jgi:hypothetical protein